jgi:hypothetical protein
VKEKYQKVLLQDNGKQSKIENGIMVKLDINNWINDNVITLFLTSYLLTKIKYYHLFNVLILIIKAIYF